MVGGEKKLANIFVQQFDTASVSDFFIPLFYKLFLLKLQLLLLTEIKQIQNNWLIEQKLSLSGSNLSFFSLYWSHKLNFLGWGQT